MHPGDRRPKGVKILVAAAAALAGAAAVLSPVAPPGASAHPAPLAPAKYFGAASCGDKNCHGQVSPRAELPACQESTTWSAVDPSTQLPRDRHNYAFNRLFEEKSTQIMAELNKREGTKDQASESERCLTCHGVAVHDYGTGVGGTAISKHKELQGGKFAPEDGVSCDGCHGPAEKYLQPHAEKEWAIKKWKEMKSEKLYNELGIYYSKDLVLWANQCVRCHLAIDTKMLDAGHPDLVPFELYGQSQQVPPHWRDYEAADPNADWLPAPGPFHGVRVWETGQVAALHSAASQLAVRARGEKHNDPAPERLKETFERALGHYTVLRHALRLAAPDPAKDVAAKVEALKALFAAEKLDAAKVAAAADALAAAVKPLGEVVARKKVDAAFAKAAVQAIANDPDALRSSRTAEQTAMGLYAVYYSYSLQAKPANGEQVVAAITEMYGALDPTNQAFLDALAKVKDGVK